MAIADTRSGSTQRSAPNERTARLSSRPHAPQGCPCPSTNSCSPCTPPPTPPYYHTRFIPLPPVSPRYEPSGLGESACCATPSAKHAQLPSSEVAPLLARPPKATSVRLKWDMAFPLDQSFDRELRVSTSSSVALREPAIMSTKSALIVVIAGSVYPYEIMVERPSDPAAPPFVTARDMLLAVHVNLAQVVTKGETLEARKRADIWPTLSTAYQRRTGGDTKKPMLRIDFLGGRTVFRGVVSAGLAGKLPRLELLVGHREVCSFAHYDTRSCVHS